MLRNPIFIFSFFLLSSQIVTAQSLWIKKADFGAGARTHATAFSIGNKGYVVTGMGSDLQIRNDLWEYDPATNTWTKKADFPGGPRSMATGFSIGNKGYFGTGESGNFPVEYYNDFWEYDPVTNTWTQIADFPGTARLGAVALSIGNKGYVGTGWDANPTWKKDFWEYDPVSNIWTKKADFGGTERQNAVAFSIGNMGYLGSGSSGNAYRDFWEYDPNSDNWTRKADIGLPYRTNAVGFAIGNTGYIGTGTGNDLVTRGDFYEWDRATDTWKINTGLGISRREEAISFVINNIAYFGLGHENNPLSDFWQFDPMSSGIEEEELLPFSIYPNPTAGMVTISPISTLNEVMDVTIFSLSGEKLFEKKGLQLTSAKTMDISHLSSGVYFIRFKTLNNIYTQKLIKK